MRQKMEKKRAFVTGAFGSVGEWLVQDLVKLGYAVTCFDVDTEVSRKKEHKLRKVVKFTTIWGDLTDAQSIDEAIEKSNPNYIAHVAAIIPPISILRPTLAEKVNVGGTTNIVSAARKLANLERLVLVSSYSVYGPCSPHLDRPKWTSQTPVNPQEEYAEHKVKAEAIVRESGLNYCVVRLCAVFPIDNPPRSPATLKFSFALPYDRREHAIDVRDAAYAVARAVHVPGIDGRTFVIGGGDGWYGTGGELTGQLMSSAGLKPFPREAYRTPAPYIEESWFFENWVDTTESQAVLKYQRTSFPQFLKDRKKRMGLAAVILPLMAGSIFIKLIKESPYYGKPQEPDIRPFAEAVHELLG